MLQTTYESAYVNDEVGLTAECFSKEIYASNDTQKYLKSHLVNTEKQKTWLAFEGQELIGSVTVIIKNDDEAELTGYYVHPNHQGQGVGRKLYKMAVDFSGNRDLILDIYVHNTKRDELMSWLSNRRIQVGVHYPHPIHTVPTFKDYAKESGFPNSELWSAKELSLPMHPYLEKDEIQYVIESIKLFFKQ